MFEVFNVPCLYVQSQAVLSLYSGGRTTGVVFDSGYGVSHSIPVFEGYTIPGGATKIDISGEHCTDELQRLLNERAQNSSSLNLRMLESTQKTFTTPTEVEQLRIMKETLTYCVENYDYALQEASESKACEKAYQLPDGSKIILGKERFCTPEILFQPELAQRDDIAREGI